MPSPVPVIGTALLALVAAGALMYSASAPRTLRFDTAGRPAIGAAGARHEIVVFEDFKCPACRQFAADVLPALNSGPVGAGQARLVFMHYPFLAPDSRSAALAAECAHAQSTALFWKYFVALYAVQGPEREAWATPALLERTARQVGVAQGPWRACLASPQAAARVAADRAQYRVALPGTPGVFVNGRRVAPTLAAIQGALDRAR